MEYTLNEGILTIIIRGEADHHACKTLIKETDKLIRASGPDKVVFSFGGVTFCDSSAIAYILGRYRLLKEMGIPAEISDISACAEKILRLAAVDKYIRFNNIKEV